jgi:ketopantoate reductase
MSILIVGAGAVGGVAVLATDLLERGRQGEVRTPLLAAAAVALRIHNDRLAGRGPARA